MRLLSYGLAVDLGYVLGRPDGPARLAHAGRRAAALTQRPEVVRLRKRGQDPAGLTPLPAQAWGGAPVGSVR
jgi:hypothetical protein